MRLPGRAHRGARGRDGRARLLGQAGAGGNYPCWCGSGKKYKRFHGA
ncbi:MAG: SEC-C metal-binding domain-containing protein [Solirubrobacteraceae bacterium]